jgi:hypothetical protein
MSQFANKTSAGFIVTAVAIGCLLVAAPATAADPAAVKAATATCKAQINEQARYNEMSWVAKRKAIKKCVADMTAGH